MLKASVSSILITLAASTAFAEDVSPNETVPTTEAPPPATIEPGTITTSPAPTTVPPCSPLDPAARVERDKAPGRGFQIAGATTLTLGLASFLVGTIVASVSATSDPTPTRSQQELNGNMAAGIAFAVVGGLSAFAGGGMLYVGNRQARRAEESRPQLSLIPGPQKGTVARLNY